ncbi:exonuclease DPD1, chloroplastic/mitochondrial isoform X2 [Rosa chinensis]|nr:exonuclease DPD1, chloroplastic/mitochondrial isoform X2 [Rosa chinensis]
MMRTSSMCYSNFQVPKFCKTLRYLVPSIRLASLGRTWAQNFKVLTTSSTTHESSANCFRSIQYSDAQAKIILDDKIVKPPPVNVLVFDIETTGLHPKKGGIIEIAFRDVQGGKNSCFQTLVNPEQDVPNSDIHGIRTVMVRRTDVPTMKELIPFLLQYIQSRQVLGGQVLLAAHNARRFDVPFLIEAFRRCSLDIPHDLLFLDTLPLAREVMKLYGPKASRKLSLQALGEFYRIPLEGSAHRAMTDVNLLTSILANMISDLKLGSTDLLQRTFKASDVNNSKKNEKKS